MKGKWQSCQQKGTLETSAFLTCSVNGVLLPLLRVLWYLRSRLYSVAIVNYSHAVEIETLRQKFDARNEELRPELDSLRLDVTMLSNLSSRILEMGTSQYNTARHDED